MPRNPGRRIDPRQHPLGGAERMRNLIDRIFRRAPPPGTEAASRSPLDPAIDAWHAGDLARAEALLRPMLAAQPDNARVLANLGMIVFEAQRFDEGLALLREAVATDPSLAVAHCNLGVALAQGGRFGEAKTHLRRSLELAPADNVYANLLALCLQTCDWEALTGFLGEIDATPPGERIARWAPRIAPYTAMLLPLPVGMKRAISDFHAARIAAAHPPLAPAPRRVRGRRAPLRIGYLSCDYRDHATAHLAAGLFAAHDRTRFAPIAYSWGSADDGYRRRVAEGFAAFHEISHESFRASAERIRADGIDILVDLKGHTGGGRPEILGYRPAPVQVSYLGCPGTLGGTLADYFVTDRIATPPPCAEEFAESLAFLPHSYQINDALAELSPAPSRAALGLPERGFVFCSLNALYKIEPEIFAAWVAILGAVPESVLWLLESNGYAAEVVRRHFAAAGADVSRVVFAPVVPRADHLARMQRADLFLDTHYVNAHTSASDALRAGVPVLTWTGTTFAARVATSLCHAAGLPEMAVDDAAAYVRAAIGLAGEPDRLAAVRATLLERRASPLFDTARCTRNLERAYEAMWQRYLSGAPPATITVAE
jgi:predicted O-linked N-acetylglucosamine transferase (SPINDLY family)